MPIKLGTVGHICIAVPDPKKSAQWWVKTLDVKKQFEWATGAAVGNDAVTIALFKGNPNPAAIDHVSFHLPNMAALRAALADLKRKKVDIEDPGDEIGPDGPGSPNMGLWFHDPDGYRWELSVLGGAKERAARKRGSVKRKRGSVKRKR